MFLRRFGLLLVVVPGLSIAANPPAAASAPKPETPSRWVFSLLPKSLQKNPQLELTVITEMTAAGRERPPVSAEAPAYFESYTSGPRHLGHSQGNESSLKQPEVERLLTRALATNGYLPAKPPGAPASILLIYTWGAHGLLTESDAENPSLSGEMIARNLLDRAGLVGGEKFAKRLLELFEQADAMSLAANAPPPPGGEPVFTPAMAEFANPVNLFKRSDPRNEFLVDQVASNVYYVVASAYDHKAMSEKRRVLLWRTRMTVASDGVSPGQAMPTMVLSAAPFFGRAMDEPQILTKRAVRAGSVEVGTPTVVESPAATPSARKGTP